MKNEFILPGDFTNLAELQKKISDIASFLGVLPQLSQTVCKIASQVFCAISLAEPQTKIKINLSKTDWELILSMTFASYSAAPLIGLDKALFSPPCRKTTYHNKDNSGTLTASWEI